MERTHEPMGTKGIDRRKFLKNTAITVAGGGVALGMEPLKSKGAAAETELQNTRQTTSICPYCAVGCGLVVHTDSDTGKIVNIEGDPNHPINQGALCAKGAALYQLAVNNNRVSKVLHRRPNEAGWREVSWDWALDRIAHLVRETRDASFEQKNSKGQTVNRITSIAHIGSAALDNEECWSLQALMRSLGLVNIEHQARI